MSETYYCLDCDCVRELDTRDACPVCGSRAGYVGATVVSVDIAKEAVRLGMEIDICE